MARAIDVDRVKREIRKNKEKIVISCKQKYVPLSLIYEILNKAPTLTPPNEPLTLEQLREMDGEPVWVEDVKHLALLKAVVQFGIDHAIQCIKEAPAADVAPVRHGRWMTTDAYPHHLYCSVCYKTYAKNAKWVNELDLPTNYCPSCGARMEKEDEHEVG